MFGTIRKHQTWLWAVIITMTIISFVYFFSPYQKMTSGSGSVNLGSINGQKITREDFTGARAEVFLYYYVTHNSWPDEKTPGFDPDRETIFRLLLLQKQKEFGIHVSDAVVAQIGREMLRPYQNKSGGSPAEIFKDQVLKQAGLTMTDFENFVRHQIGLQDLISTVALSGRLVTPEESKGLYVREHEELATEAAFFPTSNYLSGVIVTPDALGSYFTNQLPNYRIPERIQVNYVKFDLTNHLAEATNQLAKMTNLDLQIEQAYHSNPTNLLQEFKATSLEDAKLKYRERTLKNLEIQAARKKATEFAYLVEEQESKDPSAFSTVAKEKNLPVQVTAPFDRFDGPKDIAVGPSFASAAFSLTNATFAGPVLGDDAVFIISLNKRIPSEAPPFEQVRARVETDYKTSVAGALARQAGNAFAQDATNQLAQGKSFAEICAAAKVKLVEIPPFSVSTQALTNYDASTLNQFKQAAFGSAPGKVTAYYPLEDSGVVLFVKAKLPISEERMKRELPGFVNLVRSSRQNEAFQLWFRKEAERSLNDVPLLRKDRAQTGRTAKS
jgi:peptidyl-prolyl cis-trans isomerase D